VAFGAGGGRHRRLRGAGAEGPGKFSFGSPGLGSFRHVMGEAILLDPVRTGKVMAGPIGSAAFADY